MKPVLSLASILALRFFGLFLVMPLLAIYATNLRGGTPLLAGIAVGSYALMQMLFQYPFGRLSDKYGRKVMIAIGMAIFAVGSIVCAFSSDIHTLIIGRFLQGMGAVSSVITATIGDITGEENRSKAMAIMGGSIALSFVLALLIGPIVGGIYGVDMLFFATAVLSVVAILVLYLKVPTPAKSLPIMPINGSVLKLVFANADLVKLNIAMFLHSFVMTSIFIFIPLTLTRNYGWQMGDLWQIYLPALFFGVVAMGLGAVFGEKYNRVKTVMIIGVVLLIGAFLGIYLLPNETAFLALVVLVFIGINSLEPLMQSSATKFANASIRGAALGVFNTHQFFGVFVGGISAGFLFGKFGIEILALALALISIIWLIFTMRLTNPIKMKLLAIDANIAVDDLQIDGIKDCYKQADSDKLFIRYDPMIIDEQSLLKILNDKKEQK